MTTELRTAYTYLRCVNESRKEFLNGKHDHDNDSSAGKIPSSNI